MKLAIAILVIILSGCAAQNNVGVAGNGGNRGAIFGVGLSTGIGF